MKVHQLSSAIVLLLSVALILASGRPAWPQEGSEEAEDKLVMQEVVVTATRTEVPLEETTKSIEVVTKADVDDQQQSYTGLTHMLQERFGSKAHVGVVEEGYPQGDAIVRAVAAAGYGRVRLVPLMLVAGVHFEEDLAGEQSSWKSDFEALGIEVVLEGSGLGLYAPIIEQFCRHMAAALDVIPRITSHMMMQGTGPVFTANPK